MSGVQKKALQIIKENPGITPRSFAKQMWPNSKSWSHSTKCGPKGSTRGGGMSLAGGGYLGRLAKQGLIYWDLSCTRQKEFRLTRKGQAALAQA